MAHPNESVLQQGYEAFEKRDADRLFSLFADDVAFHIPGRAPISGSHRGKDEVLRLFHQFDDLTGGTVALELQHVVADAEFGVALVLATAQRENREAYEGRDVHVWRIAEGKLAELWVHPGDQYMADDFFSPAAETSPATEATSAEPQSSPADEPAVDETQTAEDEDGLEGDDEEDEASSRARRVAAKAFGGSDAPEQPEGQKGNGSGRRPKGGASETEGG
jgi:uncharacterized protein